MNRRSFAAAAALFAAGAASREPAFAAAAAVQGTVTLEGKPVRMTNAAAFLHDNAEGWLQQPLTIVFTDRPVPVSAVRGWNPAVVRMAEEGSVLGMCVRLDPAKLWHVMVHLLSPGEWGTTFNLNSIDEPLIPGLRIGPDAVDGSMTRKRVDGKGITCSLRFSALLSRDRPPKIYDGAEVASSPAYAAARAWVREAADGQLAVALSRAAGVLKAELDIKRSPKDTLAVLKGHARSIEKQLADVQRVVERDEEAGLVVHSADGIRMLRAGGEWKVAGSHLQ